MAVHMPVFKLIFSPKSRAFTIDLIDISLWDKLFPLTPRISVNVSALLDADKEVLRRDFLEFERRFIENNTEETIQ